MTLIEVVVALSMLSTGVLATASLIDGSSKAASAVDHRARGAQLAQRELETMRAMPYDSLYQSPSAPGFAPAFERRDTVTGSGAAVAPRSDEPGIGVTYSIVRHITWDSVTPTGVGRMDGALKHLTVMVGWDPSIPAIRLDSAVAPVRTQPRCVQRWINGSTASLRGVVNAYLPASMPSPAGATVVVVGGYRAGSVGPIAVGDELLVIQMTGPAAGTYEYATATTTPSGGVLGVAGRGSAGGLLNGYGVDGGEFQVVRVPTYRNATVGAAVTALPYEAGTGGVIALDVTDTLTLNAPVEATASGPVSATPARTTGPTRMSTGAGDGAARGGGIVAVRAGYIANGSELRASGQGGGRGGGGGTVAVSVERGGLQASAVAARGIAPSGAGGVLLSNAVPARVDVSGTDRGVVVTTLPIDGFVGVPLGAGCEPAVSIAVTTTTTRVAAGGTTAAVYRIQLTNGAARGTATNLTIRNLLPLGFEFRGVRRTALSRGVTRIDSGPPAVGSTAPRFGVFTVPPGGRVEIDFEATVRPDAPRGVAQDNADAIYVGTGGTRVATYPAPSTNREDITVVDP